MYVSISQTKSQLGCFNMPHSPILPPSTIVSPHLRIAIYLLNFTYLSALNN